MDVIPLDVSGKELGAHTCTCEMLSSHEGKTSLVLLGKRSVDFHCQLSQMQIEALLDKCTPGKKVYKYKQEVCIDVLEIESTEQR